MRQSGSLTEEIYYRGEKKNIAQMLPDLLFFCEAVQWKLGSLQPLVLQYSDLSLFK